jgi:chemotaxis protein histidine kinase CheA
MKKIKQPSAKILATILVGFVCLQVIDTNAVEAPTTTEQGLSEIRISDSEVFPLPPGNWKLMWKGDFNPCNPLKKDCFSDGRVLVLQNTKKDDFIGALVIRHSLTTSSYWPVLNCYSKAERGYNAAYATRRLRDNHGTRENQLVNKCSQSSDVPTPLEAYEKSWWWGQTTEGLKLLTNLDEMSSGVEIILQGLRRRRFDIDVLFNQSDLSGEEYDNLVFAWKATYIEALAASLYSGALLSDRSVLALRDPTKTRSEDSDQNNSEANTQLVKLEEEQQRKLAEIQRQEEERKEAERLAKEAIERGRVAKAEAEEQRRKLAELKRQEEERKEAERKEALRLAQEEVERERFAKAQAEERQKKAEAARQVESMEAQLKRLQDNLAKLKSQQTVPETANKEGSENLRQPLHRSPRHALVVGNAQYTRVGGLGNSVEDAKAFAKALSGFGFQVDLHTDIKDAEFKKAVLDFKTRLETGAEVVFYFAGHGVQFGTANYLLPVDVGAESSDGVRQSSVELQQILNSISEKKLRFTLAVIDACRDNPFTVAAASPNGRGLKDNPKMTAILNSKGITPTNTAAVGQMVIYSASAGQQALDNLGPNDPNPNGLFTRIFLEKMSQPGIPVDSVLRQVKKEVVRLAKSVNHEQVPALYDQTVGEFFFKLE